MLKIAQLSFPIEKVARLIGRFREGLGESPRGRLERREMTQRIWVLALERLGRFLVKKLPGTILGDP